MIPPSVTVLSALSPPPALISEGLCLLYFLLSVKCSVQNAAAFFDFPQNLGIFGPHTKTPAKRSNAFFVEHAC